MKDIAGKFVRLRDNPLIGQTRDDLILNLRSFVVRKYIVFYFPTPDGVEIIRVLHSSRDIDKTFERFFHSLSQG
jgi:toxin ParE1/3/4